MMLYIGENEENYQVVASTMEQLGVSSKVRLLRDGKSAKDYFRCCGRFSRGDGLIVPAVIFIESLVRDRLGWELLAMVKAHDDLRWAPVVMLLSEGQEGETKRACAMGAGACVQSPISANALRRLFAATGDFACMTSDSTTPGRGPT